MMNHWKYESASSSSIHTVNREPETGLMTCTCRGWTFKRHGKPRECKHIKDVLATKGFTRREEDEVVYGDLDGAFSVFENDDVIIQQIPPDVEFPNVMKASAMTKARFGHVLDSHGFIVPDQFNEEFSSGSWALEEKLDGHRCQIRKIGDQVTTQLRSIPVLPTHIVKEIRELSDVDVCLDGELMVPGGVSTDVPNIQLRDKLIFVVFDVLMIDGKSTLDDQYDKRREVLEYLFALSTNESVVLAAVSPAEWASVEAIWSNGGEGAILKQRSSTYRPGHRSPDWVKVKRLEQHTVTVTRFESGLLGPTSVTHFVFDDGTEGSCKTKNNEILAATEAHPEQYIGRRLVIQCQQRSRTGKARHGMWKNWELDHLAGEGE